MAHEVLRLALHFEHSVQVLRYSTWEVEEAEVSEAFLARVGLCEPCLAPCQISGTVPKDLGMVGPRRPRQMKGHRTHSSDHWSLRHLHFRNQRLISRPSQTV